MTTVKYQKNLIDEENEAMVYIRDLGKFVETLDIMSANVRTSGLTVNLVQKFTDAYGAKEGKKLLGVLVSQLNTVQARIYNIYIEMCRSSLNFKVPEPIDEPTKTKILAVLRKIDGYLACDTFVAGSIENLKRLQIEFHKLTSGLTQDQRRQIITEREKYFLSNSDSTDTINES